MNAYFRNTNWGTRQERRDAMARPPGSTQTEKNRKSAVVRAKHPSARSPLGTDLLRSRYKFAIALHWKLRRVLSKFLVSQPFDEAVEQSLIRFFVDLY